MYMNRSGKLFQYQFFLFGVFKDHGIPLITLAVEESPFQAFYPSLYGLQVMTEGVRHILNPERRYYQILRQLLKEGSEAGEIISMHSYAILADMITSFQIGITYNWCLQQGHYSLQQYGQELLNPFLESLRAKNRK